MKTETVTLGGREITVETGRVARQAGGAVIVHQQDTMVLVTVVAAEKPREGIDFFPLTVEYREGKWAAGKYPGGFLKREGRSAEHEILTCRLTDRSIRPLFPDGFRNEVQVVATVLSCDPDVDPSVLTLLGTPLALQLSDIPFGGPVAGVRVARVDGKLLVNPTQSERDYADLELVVSSSSKGPVMVEGEAREVPEAEVEKALLFAQDAVAPALELIQKWGEEIGKEKRVFEPPQNDDALAACVREVALEPLKTAVTEKVKQERRKKIDAVRTQIIEQICTADRSDDPSAAAGDDSDNPSGIAADAVEPTTPADLADQVKNLFGDLLHDEVRRMIAEDGTRIDGRPLDQVRPISCEAGWLPRTHGSAIFTRGETQSMAICTLGSSSDEQMVETLFGEERQRFLLHYNFPPYSVGETRPIRGPGRREIGHGNLARRALEPVLPPADKFPYTIRVVSEISESNGSSSMASVCGGCLAMMDAGVPLARPVAGVAMGLIKEGDGIHILTDILGDEDHLGDMDFKVTGSENGITALQMDNKIGSLDREVLGRALEQARIARLHILAEMAKTLAAPRGQLSPHAPRLMAHRIRPERIRDLIGPGGKVIQGLQAEFNVKVEVSDDGLVKVFAADGVSGSGAMARVRLLTDDPEVDKVYKGTVVSVKDFGAFVRILANTEGLVHISELDEGRVERTADIVRPGDEILVRVLGVDDRGKLKLSRRAALGVSAAEVEGA